MKNLLVLLVMLFLCITPSMATQVDEPAQWPANKNQGFNYKKHERKHKRAKRKKRRSHHTPCFVQ